MKRTEVQLHTLDLSVDLPPSQEELEAALEAFYAGSFVPRVDPGGRPVDRESAVYLLTVAGRGEPVALVQMSPGGSGAPRGPSVPVVNRQGLVAVWTSPESTWSLWR